MRKPAAPAAKTPLAPHLQNLASLEVICLALALALAALLGRIASVW